MAILGLVDSELVTNPTYRLENFRRRVFYTFPNGSAPLIGLLSMMKEDETNQVEFSWWEKRLKEQVTATLTQGSSKGPFRLAADAADGADPFLPVVDTTFTLYVADTTLFRVGHVVRISGLTIGNTGSFEQKAIVTAVPAATKLTLRALSLPTGISTGYDNGTTSENVGKEVQVIGSAFAHGVTDQSSEVYYFPVNPLNYTQIFRTPFSFTGNALVSPVKFDDTGIYRDKAKQHSMDHMVEQELAMIWGEKRRFYTAATPVPTTGAGLPTYTTGGILYWLQQWEAGSLYENTAATLDTDDNKRIIANSSGTLTEASYDGYLERIFRTTSNVSNEKLCLCGTGFLKVVNQMYRSLSNLVFMPPSGDTYGLEIVAHKTSFGTVYYKSHPLFSRNATLRNNALFVDVHNLRYRPMSKRDTQLLKNRQPNDADYRKDEWFTEAGLELRQPESFMYLQNVQSYTP